MGVMLFGGISVLAVIVMSLSSSSAAAGRKANGAASIATPTRILSSGHAARAFMIALVALRSAPLGRDPVVGLGAVGCAGACGHGRALYLRRRRRRDRGYRSWVDRPSNLFALVGLGEFLLWFTLW